MGLEELKKSFEELKVMNEKQEARVCYHETKTNNIIVAYLIWERLFFFAISRTSSSLKCHDRWLVFALSLSCTLVFLLVFLNAVTMLYRNQCQLDIICKEQVRIYQHILVARDQKDVGRSMEAGDPSDGFGFSFYEKIFKSDPFRIVERKVYIYTTFCALLAATAIELYACQSLLCN